MIEAIALWSDLFPQGIARYLVGGLFIGVGIAVIYLATALIPGASTVLESTLSYVSHLPRFQDARLTGSRDWRLVFMIGMVGGGALYALVFQDGIWVTEVKPWRLFVGGTLVGIGTRVGKGCTSGHGICGIGSFSTASYANVAIFVSLAVGTALVVQALGVTP